MKKVLVIATSRKTRGGITSVVLAHEKGQQWRDFHCRWLETHRDGCIWVKLVYMLKAFIWALLLIPKYQLVHIHLSEPPSALRKLPFMWWAKVWRKKTIVHFHSFSIETTLKSQWAWVYRYHFGKADRLVTLSNYWRNECGKFIGSNKKVAVIYNPCPLIEFNDTSEFPIKDKHQNVILYAGTVNPRKGYADLIKAFSKIAKHHKDWSIVFAGNGELQKGQDLAAQYGISEQTVFLGWCSGEDKDRAFRSATIFCLPSYAEGFPMAVLDAWAYGLPVVTTPVGGIPDIADDGNNMLLFQPGDIDKLAECLNRMISDSELRNRISKESVHLSTTLFNINTINHLIGELYKELL